MIPLGDKNLPGFAFNTPDKDALLKCAIAIDVVRGQLRKMAEKVPGIWIFGRSVWSKIGGDIDLAVPGPYGPLLNPSVFRDAKSDRPGVAPPVIKPVDW